METEQASIEPQVLIQVHLTEYKKLQDEIAQRMQFQNTLIIMCLASASGVASIAATTKLLDILIIIPIIYSSAMLIAARHSLANIKIAKYVSKYICPTINEIARSNNLIQWEQRLATDYRSTPHHRFVAFISYTLFYGSGVLIPLILSILPKLTLLREYLGFSLLWIIVLSISIYSWYVAFIYREVDKENS